MILICPKWSIEITYRENPYTSKIISRSKQDIPTTSNRAHACPKYKITVYSVICKEDVSVPKEPRCRLESFTEILRKMRTRRIDDRTK